MLRIGFILLLLTLLGTAHAQQGNALRVWVESTGHAQEFKNDLGLATAKGETIEAGLSYKFSDSFFAQLGYLESSIGSVEANGESIEFENSWKAKSVGLGYRAARGVYIGRYFGASLHYHFYDDNPDNNNGEITIFLENESDYRFGHVGISRVTSNATKTLIRGRHVWFAESGFGIGLRWSYKFGTDAQLFGSEFDFTEVSAGLLLMFRI